MRQEAQRYVQELAQQKAGCACGLEPTDLDIGILGPFGRIDGSVDPSRWPERYLPFRDRSGREWSFDPDTGRLFSGRGQLRVIA
jgi:hypothetical protein